MLIIIWLVITVTLVTDDDQVGDFDCFISVTMKFVSVIMMDKVSDYYR